MQLKPFLKKYLRKALKHFFRISGVSFSSRQSLKKRLSLPHLYLSNCAGFLDILYLYAFLPEEVILLTPPSFYRLKGLRFSLIRFLIKKDSRFRPFNPRENSHIQEVCRLLEEKHSCLIFAQSLPSKTGNLEKVDEAPGVIADKTGAPIVPVWIEGSQYGLFSAAKENLPCRLFPKVRIFVADPVPFKIKASYKKNQEYISTLLSDILLNACFKTRWDKKSTLFTRLLSVNRLYGGAFGHRFLAEDMTREKYSYSKLLREIYIFASFLKPLGKYQEHIGVFIPNSLANLISFMALSSLGRVPAMLNPTMGAANILSVCKTVGLKTIITSKVFIENIKAQSLLDALLDKNIQIIYTEDLFENISLADRLISWGKYLFRYKPAPQDAKRKGVILFTSGSEGMPKAVVLSQQNLVSNILQYQTVNYISKKDLVFNALPMFHSFGLTIGTLMPLLTGAGVFLYPTPLHYRMVPDLIYETGATIMFCTDTFMKGYARNAHPHDFRSMRFLLGGAEAVKKDTRSVYAEKFGIRILEGYGATECAPIVTISSLIFYRPGSIGRFVPGMEYRLEKQEGIDQGAVLFVKGPNVMIGYIYADAPGKIVPPEDGWYSTGDVVRVDDFGYAYILDRVKRFAKLAGEMVSLTSVELLAYNASGLDSADYFYGAVAVPHPQKGEQIILVTNNRSLNAEILRAHAKKQKISELYLPQKILYRDALPTLQSGKRDNITLKKEVLQELATNEPNQTERE